jgi:hypothetical protein
MSDIGPIPGLATLVIILALLLLLFFVGLIVLILGFINNKRNFKRTGIVIMTLVTVICLLAYFVDM